MAAISAKDVQALRKATGAGMMDAKRALEAADGDMEAATKALREKGLAKAAGRADRENTQGAVAAAVSDGRAALVELKSETDFVAKSPEFAALVSELAEAVAVEGDEAVSRFSDRIDDMKVTLKENIEVGRIARFEAAEGNVLDTYVHVQADRGVNGVLVELASGSVELAHEVAVHISFARPKFLSRDEVPAEVVEAERETLTNITLNEGKPEAAVPKIVEGRLNGFFKEVCLLEQGYVRDDKTSVEAHLGDAELVRFAQIEIG